MADQRWYIAVEGNRLGPFPADQLTELAKEGKLEPETLVWRKGMSAWLPARDVPEVQPLLGSGTTESAGTQADTTPAPAEKPAVTSGWFVAEGGTKLGPMTSDKIEALAREGRLEPDSLVWRKGMPQWKAAKEVSEMADALAARPDAAAAAAEPEQEPAPAGEQPEPKPEPAAGPRWYIAYESERIGPFSEEDLPGLLAEKKLAPGSLVWRKGMSAWKRAMEIPELDGILAAAPAPAPASDTSWESEGEAEEPEAAARPEDAAKEAAAVEDIISRIADNLEAETEPAGSEAWASAGSVSASGSGLSPIRLMMSSTAAASFAASSGRVAASGSPASPSDSQDVSGAGAGAGAAARMPSSSGTSIARFQADIPLHQTRDPGASFFSASSPGRSSSEKGPMRSDS